VSCVDSVEKLKDSTTVAGLTPTAAPTRRWANVSRHSAFSVAFVIGVQVGVARPALMSAMAASRIIW
jgi:hypothetical protein